MRKIWRSPETRKKEGFAMSSTIRKVSYCYLIASDKAGEGIRILDALRARNVNLLAVSAFPQGRNKAQVDLVAEDLAGIKALAKQQKWKLSPTKRAFLAHGTDEVGAAIPPLAKLAAAKINVTAATAVTAGEGRFGMIFWVEPRNYNRAAKLLEAT
jgi:hypothetical protein